MGPAVLLAVMAWFDDTGFVGGDNGLYPVAAAYLHQDVADIGLDGGFAEEELAGDFAVGQAAGDLDENLGLPGGSGPVVRAACSREAAGRIR
jgi:hypothetical protein